MQLVNDEVLVDQLWFFSSPAFFYCLTLHSKIFLLNDPLMKVISLCRIRDLTSLKLNSLATVPIRGPLWVVFGLADYLFATVTTVTSFHMNF